MRTTSLILGTPGRRILGLTVAVFSMVLVSLSFAQQSKPKTFSSPEEASSALFSALQNDDEQLLEQILGGGKEVTSSSDPVEDRLERERFGQKYQEMHRLVREPDGNTVLYIGAENWPFPIPLVQSKGRWYFDSQAGMQEIQFRTIGEAEATAIQVCDDFAQTKKQQRTQAATGDPIRQYAEGLVNASAGTPAEKQSAPFHGYYFRTVTRDAAGSTGKNKQVALVAYPAEYQSSGVMTFIVTLSGGVYEKDLGPDTAKRAPQIKQRKPASSWHAADKSLAAGPSTD